jgi:acetyl-CoA carboxylase alpha subunit
LRSRSAARTVIREAMAETLKNALLQALAELQPCPTDELVTARRAKLAGYGVFKEG